MNEKDILEILTLFEIELDERMQESEGELEKVKYYAEFSINGIVFKNIFMTSEKDVDGNVSYHVYCGDSSNEILAIDSEGNVIIKNEALNGFIDGIDLESLIQENDNEPGRLRGISEKATPEEMEEALSKKNNEDDRDNQEQDEDANEIEESLKEQGEEDLEISQYRKIKDTEVAKRMPDVFGNGNENGLAYSNKLNRYVMISKQDGQYQVNKNVQPAKMTWKSVISVESDPQSVGRKYPHALMDTNRDDKKIAVIIGQYGEVNIETVEVCPCKERVEYISRGVRSEGQGLDKQQSNQLTQDSKASGVNGETDIGNGQEEIEQEQRDTNQPLDDKITEDDYIPNTDKKWGKLMEETGESLTELIKRYNREMEKNLDSKKAVEAIENDYGRMNRQHEHKQN